MIFWYLAKYANYSTYSTMKMTFKKTVLYFHSGLKMMSQEYGVKNLILPYINETCWLMIKCF